MGIKVTGFYRTARAILNVVMTPWITVSASGAEHLPREGGFLLVCNHISQVDPLVTTWYLARQDVAVRIMAKVELFSVPVLRSILKAMDMVPVDRRAPDPATVLEPTKESLRDGNCVGIYPEGTLTSDPEGWPMKMKTGAARLALDTGVPVIPFAQWGAQEIMPYAAKLPSLLPGRKVRGVFGRPVDLSDLISEAGSADREAVEEATRRIHAALTTLVGELRGEEPPEGIWDPRAGVRTDKAV